MPIFLNIDLSSLIIQMEETIEAPAEKVFDALTGDISGWWGFPFLLSPDDAVSVTIDPKLGGLFYESWGDDGSGVILGTVTRLKKGRRLSIQGYMSLPGPLAGLIDFQLTPNSPTSTTVKLFHSAFGTFDWQANRHYEPGWKHLLNIRLKQHVEQGRRFEFR